MASAALLGAVALAASMIVPAALGYHRYVIAGGSMDGAYDRGSVVFERAVPVRELRVGDVITYDPPAEAGTAGLVTHRISSVHRVRGEGLVFRTMGDANRSADSWRFTLDAATQPRVAFSIPYVGYGLAALSIREVRMVFLGLPALLIAVSLLVGLWREAGEQAQLGRSRRAQPRGG